MPKLHGPASVVNGELLQRKTPQVDEVINLRRELLKVLQCSALRERRARDSNPQPLTGHFISNEAASHSLTLQFEGFFGGEPGI